MGTGLVRRVGVAVTMAGALGATVVACEPPPPPVVVENPGVFVGTNLSGSFYEYLDANGTPMERSFFDSANPACANDIDDDADGLVDTGADPDCDSPDDANERLDGVQDHRGSYLPTTIEADGKLRVDPGELVVEPMEKCLMNGGELWCLNIQPHGAGPVREGIATRDHVVVAIPMTIKFDLISGYPGWDDRCEIPYTENVYVGDGYDEETGIVVLESAAYNPAPAIENCGDWTDLLNAVLGLPGTGHSTLVVEMRNAAGEVPRIR